MNSLFIFKQYFLTGLLLATSYSLSHDFCEHPDRTGRRVALHDALTPLFSTNLDPHSQNTTQTTLSFCSTARRSTRVVLDGTKINNLNKMLKKRQRIFTAPPFHASFSSTYQNVPISSHTHSWWVRAYSQMAPALGGVACRAGRMSYT